MRRVVPLLLFGSGACALIYQTAWLREFRLVFGASTAATSAVLAIFMAGLGIGGLILGRRADSSPNPLRFYGDLELLISLSAAISPLLILFIRWLYLLTGGSAVMGLTLATIIRLVLAALVLAVPTVLMGGTLPAAARAVERDGDVSRRELALIYGTNTIGAVTGTVLATFFLLETFGTRTTLWIAALINLLVGLAARILSRRGSLSGQAEAARAELVQPRGAPAPKRFVLVAAAVVGFAFLVMELVWYRMLGPLLGGSTFTFGLILALALLGIGLGGVVYSWVDLREVTLAHLAATCALEALFMALPLALGDRLAVLALLLRPVGAAGFGGFVLGWTLVASIVVLPAALVAGFQFPLLIALLGRGRHDVGKHVGVGYLWNTAGAIAGSLAGGFGLLPLLTAPGVWRLVVVVLLVLAFVTVAIHVMSERSWRPAIAAILLSIIPIPMLFASGPTASWRHSGIGAGRAGLYEPSRNGLRDWLSRYRRYTIWEREGVESSVALYAENGLSFIINGKNDGNTRRDAGTQVMSGILGALLHGNVRNVLVVGLGTGSTSGWLAELPGVRQIHTVELESAVLEVARRSAPVNRNAMSNPRLRSTIGDAREVLLTIPEKYDLIFSEPSNPYRAGIASMFTREFYLACAKRLAPGGMFVQWMQAYEVDAETVQTVIGTLATVFPHVDLWQTNPGDLLLVASKEPRIYDARQLRQRIVREPFRSALFNAWRVWDLEGVMARFIAGSQLGQAVMADPGFRPNTDDLNLVEFGFARSVGAATNFDLQSVRLWARQKGGDRLRMSGDDVDWTAVEDRRVSMMTNTGMQSALPAQSSPELQQRHAAQAAFLSGNLAGALHSWGQQKSPPRDPVEISMVAMALANKADPRSLPLIERLRPWQPVEADAILSLLQFRQKDVTGAVETLVRAFHGYRQDPWPMSDVMYNAMIAMDEIALTNPETALRLQEALSQPFSVFSLEDERRLRRVNIASRALQGRCNPAVIGALHDLEPHVPWRQPVLEIRRGCYQRVGDPRAEQARRDLASFIDDQAQGRLDLP